MNKKIIFILILIAIAAFFILKPNYEIPPSYETPQPQNITAQIEPGTPIAMLVNGSAQGKVPIIDIVTIYDNPSDKEIQESYIKQFENSYDVEINDIYCYKGNLSNKCEIYKGYGNVTKEIYPIVMIGNPYMTFIYVKSSPIFNITTPLKPEDIKYTLCNRYNYTQSNICK